MLFAKKFLAEKYIFEIGFWKLNFKGRTVCHKFDDRP